MTAAPTCAGCRYAYEVSRGRWLCRRYPPAPDTGFPWVDGFDWCGEWQPVSITIGGNLAPPDVCGAAIRADDTGVWWNCNLPPGHPGGHAVWGSDHPDYDEMGQ